MSGPIPADYRKIISWRAKKVGLHKPIISINSIFILKTVNTPRPLQDFDVHSGGDTEMPVHRILFGTAGAIVLVGQSAPIVQTQAAMPPAGTNRTVFTPADFAQFNTQNVLVMVRRVPGFAHSERWRWQSRLRPGAR